METMNRDRILDRIKKALNLSKSPNQAEAESAMAKVQELLTIHNLTMQDIEGHTLFVPKEYIKDFVYFNERKPSEHRYIWNLLEECFFVKTITTVTFHNDRYVKAMAIVGTRENVEISKYVYEFLTRTYQDCFKQYRKDTGAPTTFKRSYYAGLYSGLLKKMKAERERVEQTMALVIVEDPELINKYEEMFPNRKSGANVKVPFYEHAWAAGHEKSREININPGLSGNKAPLSLR